MKNSIEIIAYTDLALAFIPVFIVVAIYWKWNAGHKTSILALIRMLVQLFIVGYLLEFIFSTNKSIVIVSVLSVMLIASSLIALRTTQVPLKLLFWKCLFSLAVGSGSVLILITQVVLSIEPWFQPSYMIPLAGMIFANAMNSISLAVERLSSEIDRGVPYEESKVVAFRASLIPITNSLLAVGLVSLPGMMTGQILSGVSPIIASRYQIMVMCMTFASAGISAAMFLTLVKSVFNANAAVVQPH